MINSKRDSLIGGYKMRKLIIFMILTVVLSAKNYVITESGQIYEQDRYYQIQQNEMDAINKLNETIDFEIAEPTWICEDDLWKYEIRLDDGIIKKSGLCSRIVGKLSDLDINTKKVNDKLYLSYEDLKKLELIK